MRHALNVLERCPRAELGAASSPDPVELEWAKTHLKPFGVRQFQNDDDMLKQESLQAIVVASATAVHAEQAIKAINADKHVLCEKQLSTSVEVVIKPATNSILRASSSPTPNSPEEFSIFVDCSIHDIDLTLWFFGANSKVKSVSAVGNTAVEPDLHKHNDRDNAEDTTEIIGTKGKLTVNVQPQMNLVNIFDDSGVRREIPETSYDRFEYAFVTEAHEFTACVLEDRKLPLDLNAAVQVQAVRIGAALQESMVGGKKIVFDGDGNRVEVSKL
ncbi:uncharacterized protein N7477_008682 [Penicillium maclennaniae]|uniref:uncharacterized protein n=1 Tax=Penicillium maclennaniae TaxID=1343394 RepID=UPI0025417B3A|nr:uncharacterized protein N7477_008682 [Penicillium maclennaniae]KAJ5666234.1 hypothetical protein N7477_008682 [Penicillium maclennaniae]